MSKPTHTAIAITSKGIWDTIQVETLKPGPEEILLKVEYAAMIAADTYMADTGLLVAEYPMVFGFGAAGTIVEVGQAVNNFAVGDRITAYTYQNSRAKSVQEYSLLSRTVCAKIPDELSLAEASTIPDNFVTAYYTLFDGMGLPNPTSFLATVPRSIVETPFLVYGAGATSGQYAIQLLKLNGYQRIFATASPKHHDYLRSLGATDIFDYASPTLTADILNAAGGKISHAIDCISAADTLAIVSQVVTLDAKVAILLPIKEGNAVTGVPGSQMYLELSRDRSPFPDTVKALGIRTFFYQTNEYLKENLMPNILPSLLAMNAIRPNIVRLIDQGTLKERVDTGLDLLRNNRVSGEKVVIVVGH